MAIWNKMLGEETLYPHITPGRRILVISDIHANLIYFKALLEKVGFCDNDVLIIDGDFLEKGGQCLDTLRFIMELVKAGNTYALAGNCDSWAEAIDMTDFSAAPKLLHYMLYKRSGIFYEMFMDCGVELNENTDIVAYIPLLRVRYAEEWDFLRKIPVAIDTPHYTFVHGGIRPDIPMAQQRCGDCMKLDDFRSQGWSFDKWVIVGHWPVTLYIEDHVCAYPIIDRDRKIVSIDGGCVLKDDGQLNALVIPYEGSEDFSCVWYDPFPTAHVRSGQKASERSYYIRWGDSAVEVLQKGGEFSRCRHIRTGYEMDILTTYLFTGEDGLIHTNDCSDYFLPLNAGDEVSIIEKTSRGYYVKHNGTSGWYRGELE